LLHLKYRGGNLAPSIPVEIQWRLKEQLGRPEGFGSYKEIQVWLKEHHGLDVPYSTVHGTVKYRMNADPKVPRPYAEQYDAEAVEAFKAHVPQALEEILTPCLKRYSTLRYRTQDESRFGLNNDHAAADYPKKSQAARQNPMAVQSILSLRGGGTVDR
jgi:hypothetical protein